MAQYWCHTYLPILECDFITGSCSDVRHITLSLCWLIFCSCGDSFIKPPFCVSFHKLYKLAWQRKACNIPIMKILILSQCVLVWFPTVIRLALTNKLFYLMGFNFQHHHPYKVNFFISIFSQRAVKYLHFLYKMIMKATHTLLVCIKL